MTRDNGGFIAHTLDPSSRENRDVVAASTTGVSRRGFLAGIAGAAALTHLGRTFITSVTMQAGASYRLRCQSNTTIDISELFAPANSTGRTFDSYLKASGRVEAIWFPFTTTP